MVRLIRILVRDGAVGLSPDSMNFKTIVEFIEHFWYIAMIKCPSVLVFSF